MRTDDDVRLEKEIHQNFSHLRGNGEWFDLDPADILPILKHFGIDGLSVRPKILSKSSAMIGMACPSISASGIGAAWNGTSAALSRHALSRRVESVPLPKLRHAYHL